MLESIEGLTDAEYALCLLVGALQGINSEEFAEMVDCSPSVASYIYQAANDARNTYIEFDLMEGIEGE